MTRRSATKPMAQRPHTVSLRIQDIVPDPNQPRKTFTPDGISSLAKSLQGAGQISPIVVRPGTEGKHIVITGERRWRAAKEASLSHLDCIILEDIGEQKVRDMQLAENYQREDIPPLEQARSFTNYLDRYKVSQSELSRRTGIPQRTISHRLALLTLPASLQARIEAGEIGPYEAERIATLPADQQEAVAEAVASGEIGGRALEEMIHQFPRSSNRQARQPDQRTKAVETTFDISQRLETLEKAVFELAATYAFNEAARRRGGSNGREPPCPQCLRRGESGSIQGIKRKMTAKDRKELESIVSAEDLGPAPTHIIEARCNRCDYVECIDYAWE